MLSYSNSLIQGSNTFFIERRLRSVNLGSKHIFLENDFAQLIRCSNVFFSNKALRKSGFKQSFLEKKAVLSKFGVQTRFSFMNWVISPLPSCAVCRSMSLLCLWALQFSKSRWVKPCTPFAVFPSAATAPWKGKTRRQIIPDLFTKQPGGNG